MALKNINLRFDEKTINQIDLIVKLDPLQDKVQVYRKAIDIGLKEISKELAIKLFAEGEISMAEGAKLCDIYIGEFMDLLRDRGITQKPYTPEQEAYIYKCMGALKPAFLAARKKMIKYNVTKSKNKKDKSNDSSSSKK